MPITLSKGPSRAPAAGAVAALLECHERIRRFTETARRLALVDADNVDLAQVREAAAGVRRYFTVAFPLHGADEEELLAPLLRGRQLDAATEEALSLLRPQHAALDAGLAELIPAWSALAEEADRLAALQPTLRPLVERFAGLVEPHLRMEEEALFPAAARLLTTEEQIAIQREMQRRREGGFGPG